MAGLEVVVRPVVFPNIRPQPTRSLPPQDDPDKGFAVIHGQGAKQIDLTNSYSASTTSSQQTEIRRRVDRSRVSQKNADGSINKQNFVDVDVANKIWMQGPTEKGGPAGPGEGGGHGGDINVPAERATGRDITVHYYTPVKEEKNIEIKKRNIIIESPSGGGGGGGG